MLVQWNGLSDRERAADVHAVHEPQQDHRDARDAGRARAAEQRRQRERDAAEEQREEPAPQGEAGGGERAGSVSPRAASPKSTDPAGWRASSRPSSARARQVGGELLERDPALAERRRGHQVEAAPAGLAGQGPGQREDRPEGGAEGEDRPVLEGHVAAQRADLVAHRGRVAEEVDHLGRHAADELVHVEAVLRRGEDVRDPHRQDQRHPAEQAGGDDEREPRIADRLAVDAAEAVPAG